MKISKFIPRKIAALSKSRDILPDFKEKIVEIEKNPGAYVYLLGSPNHQNMGDHLIAVAEKEFLENEYHFSVMDITTEMYHIYRERLKKHIPSSSLIFITGGGWMGDVWPIEEKTIENMAYDFRKNPALIFPQTIFYKDQDVSNDVSQRAEKIFSQCDNLTISVRDKLSFDYACKHYRNKVVLCPDIALYHEKRLIDKAGGSKRIGFCFREDREKINHITYETLSKELYNPGIEFVKLSTISDMPISCDKREESVDTLLNTFGHCDLIFTDRLHGMIYSYLAGVPCIAFDNRTKKVSGVYNLWLSESSQVRLFEEDCELEKIIEEAKSVLTSRKEERAIEAISFKTLNEVIDTWQK